MTTATYPALGDRLAAKLKPAQIRRGRRRPRAKRPAKHRAHKPRTDSRVSAFKAQLEQTENGRRMLQFVEQAAKARLAEEVTELGLESAERHEDSTRERCLRATEGRSPESIRETERLRGQLLAAEAKTQQRRAEYQRHRAERGRLEGESQHLAGYL